MTEKQRKECREVIDRDGWHKFGIIEEGVYPQYWNKKVQIMYEDMDGVPRTGTATYVANPGCARYFRGESPKIKDARMCDVFAWRPM